MEIKLFPSLPRPLHPPPPHQAVLTSVAQGTLLKMNSYYTTPLSKPLSGLSWPPQPVAAALTHQAHSQLRASHLRFPLPGRPFPTGASGSLPPSFQTQLRYCPPTLLKAAAPRFSPPHSLPCFVLFCCIYHHLTSSVFRLFIHCWFCTRQEIPPGEGSLCVWFTAVLPAWITEPSSYGILNKYLLNE